MWLLVTSTLYYAYVMLWYTDIANVAAQEVSKELEDDSSTNVGDDDKHRKFRIGLMRVCNFSSKTLLLGVWLALWIKDIVFLGRFAPSLSQDSNARYVAQFAFGTAATFVHVFMYIHTVWEAKIPVNFRDAVYSLGMFCAGLFLVGRLILHLLVCSGIYLEESGSNLVKEEIYAFVLSVLVLASHLVHVVARGRRMEQADHEAEIRMGAIGYEDMDKKGGNVFPNLPATTVVYGLPLSFIVYFNLMETFSIMKFYGDYGRFYVVFVLRVLLPCLTALWTHDTKYWFTMFVTACMVEYQAYTFFAGFRQQDTSIINPLNPYIPSNATNLAFRHESFLMDFYDQGDANPLAINADQVEGTYWTYAGLATVPALVYVVGVVGDLCKPPAA